jgi:hypothetical protein
MRKIIILDTSILCVSLQVPGKDTCGSDSDRWDRARVDRILQAEETEKTTFVLPLAVIIETGNHIAQASVRRYETALKLADIMKKTVDSQTPWAAFTQQSELWDADSLKQLADEFPELAKQNLALGDATIKRVAEFYARSGHEVQILTADAGLKSYEPSKPPLIPRRRKKKKS